MSHRKVISIVERSPADPGTSPNAHIAQITVDVRVAFPPGAPAQDIDAAIMSATARLRADAWTAAAQESWLADE